MNPRNSVKLYSKLAKKAVESGVTVPACHKYLFDTSNNYFGYYDDLYLAQLERGSVGLTPKLPPFDQTCDYCKPFHLGNLKNIDKDADICFGNDLERVFVEFCNKEFHSQDLKLNCERADSENLHMPDFKIVNDAGDVVFYLELKAIFRPFIKISEKVNSKFQCYSNSLTLDVSNGKKLGNQKELVEKLGTHNVAYVYWYDLPCVKGVFWLPSHKVYTMWSEQNYYKRNVVSGDINDRGEVRGSVKKIYIPLHEMNDFASLISTIKDTNYTCTTDNYKKED